MLNKDYGTVDFDNLVITAGDAGAIQLQAGQGTLARGAVIDSNGKLLGIREGKVKESYAITADTAYDSTKTYYTKSENEFTKASISEFEEGTTYYEKVISDEIEKASYILCDETETDDTDTVTGIVWKSGNFIRESLIVATGYELTDNDIADLRDVNIIVESAMK